MGRVEFFAAKYHIPIGLARALIGQESGGNPGAVSPAGATGLTQVLPSTAASMYGISEAEAKNRLRNPEFALDAGFRYLKTQFDTFKSWRLALAAYNAGPHAVEAYHGVPPYQETQNYVRNILTKAGVLSSPGTGSGSTGLVPPLAGQVAAPDPKLSAAMTGLQDLASGHFNPVHELGVLKQAQDAAAAHPLANDLGNTPLSTDVQINGRMTPRVRKAVSLIQEYQGTPYVYGGTTPAGFDCSGLLQYVWGKEGVKIPRTTYDQWTAGQAIGRGQLQPGDAVFFRGSDPHGNLPGHVGMYIGGGKFVEAPHTGATVHISNLAGRSDYVGARRFA